MLTYAELQIHTLPDTCLHMNTHFPTDNDSKLTIYLVFHASFRAFANTTIQKRRLASSLHRSEMAQCCLNNNFSVQLNSCWRSSLPLLLPENSPLPLFNPLMRRRERGRESERDQHWMLTGTLLALPAYLVYRLPPCRYTLPPQWSHKNQIGAFREIACALKINNICTGPPKKVSRDKNDIGRLKVSHP